MGFENRSGKTTAIRRIAVRETGVSCHDEGLIMGPSDHHSTIVLRVLRAIPNWDAIMPRDASLFLRTAREANTTVFNLWDYLPPIDKVLSLKLYFLSINYL